jgi:hypothetical protein
MPTTTAAKSRNSTKKALTDYYVYAPIGAGDLLLEKTRDLSRKTWTEAQKQRRKLLKSYRSLAERGEKLVGSVSKSAYTRRAVDQAKTARSQVKAAVTSIRKTADASATATRAAAKKVS